MQLLQALPWDEYQLLDSGDGKRLERFGKYILVRPDPQAIWKPLQSVSEWEKADAIFTNADEKDHWLTKTDIPSEWLLTWKNLSFWAKLSPFKHTGIFPEQTANWEFITQCLTKTNGPKRILNLFAYTGIASLVAAAHGANVTHVDASRPAIGWAKENQLTSKLSSAPIRWILDDAVTFTKREIKRRHHYDGIIMDPPVYGHGPSGETWDFMHDFASLLDQCFTLLSDTPLFIIINAYAVSASALMLKNLLDERVTALGGSVQAGELVIKEQHSDRLLSTGIFARWAAP